MATGTTTLAQGNGTARAIGSGSGPGALTLCSISIGAQERGVRVHGLALSDAGEALEVQAIGAVIPDDGVSPSAGSLVLTGDPALTSTQNGIEFTVDGTNGVTWRGFLLVETVPDYAV